MKKDTLERFFQKELKSCKKDPERREKVLTRLRKILEDMKGESSFASSLAVMTGIPKKQLEKRIRDWIKYLEG